VFLYALVRQSDKAIISLDKLSRDIAHYGSRDVALWRPANHNNRCYLAAYNLGLRGSWVLALATNRCSNKGNFERIA